MLGIAEIEGDPFKVEESTRKLEREVGPLELEIKERSSKRRMNAGVVPGGSGGSSGSANRNGSGRNSGLSSVFLECIIDNPTFPHIPSMPLPTWRREIIIPPTKKTP